jgi:hypothetical protein
MTGIGTPNIHSRIPRPIKLLLAPQQYHATLRLVSSHLHLQLMAS